MSGQRQNATVLMSESEQRRVYQEAWGYSDAVITDNTICLSGVLVVMTEDNTLEAAYTDAYQRIEAILARAGASWDDVVDIISFHTDVAGQIETMASVHKRYVKQPYPAWTAIGINNLLAEGVTEIKVTAKRPPIG